MNQDTRKDMRVKAVNLVVRYKSATVDEFMEEHSRDISRGGIFIETAQPFEPGTLLKFEMHLATDTLVMSGVGRVVWKRDGAEAAVGQPRGMGVKFIKIDEASRLLINQLVARDPSAGSAYAAEMRSAPMTAGHRPTNPAPSLRRPTMLGIGLPGAESRAAKANPAEPMFPVSGPGMVAEPTMMKQAAELLEEALKEAGGIPEDVGQNPLFAQASGAIESQRGEPRVDMRASGPPSRSEPPIPASESIFSVAHDPPAIGGSARPSRSERPGAPALPLAPVVLLRDQVKPRGRGREALLIGAALAIVSGLAVAAAVRGLHAVPSSTVDPPAMVNPPATVERVAKVEQPTEAPSSVALAPAIPVGLAAEAGVAERIAAPVPSPAPVPAPAPSPAPARPARSPRSASPAAASAKLNAPKVRLSPSPVPSASTTSPTLDEDAPIASPEGTEPKLSSEPIAPAPSAPVTEKPSPEPAPSARPPTPAIELLE